MAKLKTPAKSKAPPGPSDRKEFSRWLRKRPHQWSLTIAARAVLRGLPLLRGLENPTSILSAFRAMSIVRFAAKYPNRDLAAAAGAAFSAAVAAQDEHYAITVAVASAANGIRRADSSVNATMVAAIAADEFGARAVADTAVKHDAQLLQDGVLTPERLAREKLWPFPAPGEFAGAWEGFSVGLHALGGHWKVWTDWYENIVIHEPHRGIAEAEDAAFTDIAGELPWDNGAEAVNLEIARRLKALRPDPTPVEGIPSPIAISRMADGRIGANAGALNATALPPSLTPEDHAGALAACRGRAEQLRTLAASPKFQGRSDYAEALAAYLEWLPSAPGLGNILLADGEARVLNKLFTADEGILPTGFAGRLSVLLEDHIGLRPHYPELERHYQAVRTGRLTAPLSRDAVEGIRQAIHVNTPDVFHESVSPAMDETAKPVPDIKPPLPEDAPPPDPARPKPPRDPIAEVDPAKSRNFTFASGANRIWEILKKGKDAQQGAEGWQKTYEQFKPHIGTIIDWLKDFWPGGGDGMPPMAG